MGSRRLHVENDLSARPWKNGEEGYSRKDPCDKRLKGEPCQNVVVKLDVEGKAKAKGGRQNWESFLKKKAGAQVLNSIPVNVSSYLRILFVFFFLAWNLFFIYGSYVIWRLHCISLYLLNWAFWIKFKKKICYSQITSFVNWSQKERWFPLQTQRESVSGWGH